MQKDKRGQLTIFVIIAIVLVVLILVYLYNGNGFLGEKKYDPEVEVVRQNILDCFERNYQDALTIVGVQGGYLEVPEPKEEFNEYFFSLEIPYYYISGETNYPSVEDMQRSVEDLVDLSLEGCFEEQKASSSIDSLEFSAYDTDALIGDDGVTFTTNVLMTAMYNNKSVTVDFANYPVIVNSQISQMHDLAVFIAEYLKNNNEWLPYSDIVEMSEDYDLYVSIEDDSDGSMNYVEIKTIRDGYYPASFSYYNKYGAMNLEEVLPLL